MRPKATPVSAGRAAIAAYLVDQQAGCDHDSTLWSLVVFELWRLECLGDGAAL